MGGAGIGLQSDEALVVADAAPPTGHVGVRFHGLDTFVTAQSVQQAGEGQQGPVGDLSP